MAEIYNFTRETEDDLIIVTVRIGNSVLDLVLDTGASHTFINFGVLIKEGYRVGDTKGLVPVETAKGIIYANRYEVSKITALGIVKENFEVTSYIFDDPETNYQGVIGLDFLNPSFVCSPQHYGPFTFALKRSLLDNSVV
jgi:predicted aspartyl protease